MFLQTDWRTYQIRLQFVIVIKCIIYHTRYARYRQLKGPGSSRPGRLETRAKKPNNLIFSPFPLFFLTNTLFAIYHHFGWCNLFLKIFNIYIVLSDELMPKLYLYILELLLYHFFCWHLMSATNTRNTHIHATKKYFFLVINTIFVAKLCISFLTPYLTQIRVRPLSDTNAVIGHNN